MVKECMYNNTVNISFTIIFQVVSIFTFLTIFFFYYVVNIEKSEFKSQMNIIVDNILPKDTIKNIIPHGLGNITASQESIIISSIIDTIINKNIIDDTNEGVKVIATNNNIKKTGFISLIVVVGITLLITIGFLLFGYCIPIISEIKELLWVVLFVGLTELVFLLVIAKNYISADPNYVRRIIGKSITDWITKHKKI
jgi:hypothetical protein